MNRRVLLVGAVAALAGLLIVGCSKKEAGVLKREGEPDYVTAFDEKRMDAAISEARESLRTFEAALEAREPGTDAFAVKKGFQYGTDGTEYIWLTDVSRTDDGFVGRVDNEPVDAVGISLGEMVTVPRADVVDWMFMSRGKLKGGYTIVALAYGTPEQAEYGERMGIDWTGYRFLEGAK